MAVGAGARRSRGAAQGWRCGPCGPQSALLTVFGHPGWHQGYQASVPPLHMVDTLPGACMRLGHARRVTGRLYIWSTPCQRGAESGSRGRNRVPACGLVTFGGSRAARAQGHGEKGLSAPLLAPPAVSAESAPIGRPRRPIGPPRRPGGADRSTGPRTPPSGPTDLSTGPRSPPSGPAKLSTESRTPTSSHPRRATELRGPTPGSAALCITRDRPRRLHDARVCAARWRSPHDRCTGSRGPTAGSTP